MRSVKNSLSLAWEKINTVIERDIVFVMAIMVGGLLHSNEYGMRGFPMPWLFTSGGPHVHVEVGALIFSLIIVTALVVAVEVLNAVSRRGTEPTAFRNTGSQASVYANTYDDSHEFQDIPDTGAFERKDTRNYSKALQKNQKLFRKNESAVNKPVPTRTKYVMGHGEKSLLRIFLSIFAVSIILLGAVAGVFQNDSFDDDIASDDNDTEYTDDSSDDYGSLIDTPFFNDDEYLQSECDRIIDLLRTGDEAGLAEIGEGDVKSLLALTDWATAEFQRDFRYAVSGDPDEGFIRFLVTNDSDSYILCIKFVGDGLATDEAKASVAGLSACTSKPWDDYDSEDEDAWGKFKTAVDENRIVIGDDEFMGYNILTW